MSISNTVVQSISKDLANDFLSKFEILGSVGLGVWHWGLKDSEDLLSVITFGTTCFGGRRGWIAGIADKHDLRIFQICRGGTIPNAPTGTPSRAISQSCRAMKLNHGPFIAVAYANESLGEIGTIYQACGALYTGKTDPKGQANYVIHGALKSAWSVRKMYGTRDRKKLAVIDPDLQVIPLIPKHRYIFVYAPRLAKRAIMKDVEKFLKPYPKGP